MRKYEELQELREQIKDIDDSLGYYSYSYGGPDNGTINIFNKTKFSSPDKEVKLQLRRELVNQLYKVAEQNIYQKLTTGKNIDLDDLNDDTWGEDSTKEEILHMAKIGSLEDLCIIEYPETCCDYESKTNS